MNSGFQQHRLGILGGTFDPVHNGHITVAEEVYKTLHFDKVLFMPTGVSWQKMTRNITAAEYRVDMLKLAIADHPYFAISTLEVERPGATYTVDTLRELRDKYGSSTDLYFVLGWDALLGAPSWKEPGKIIELCYVVTVPRPHTQPPDKEQLERLIPGISRKLIMLEKPLIDISSTEIRNRIAEKKPWDHLVPKAVAEYIKNKGLYTRS